jgi:hypothetical protein
MRHFWILCTILILLILMAFTSGGQTLPREQQPAIAPPAQPLPDNPAPASSLWNRVEELPHGEKVKIRYASGHSARCRFAGATDTLLFCDPNDAPSGADTFPIDRRNIVNVSADHTERNARLILAAFMVTGGIWAGVQSTKSVDDGTAVFGGFLGAGLGWLVGYPAACISGYCPSLHLAEPQPAYGFNIAVPFPSRQFARKLLPVNHP